MTSRAFRLRKPHERMGLLALPCRALSLGDRLHASHFAAARAFARGDESTRTTLRAPGLGAHAESSEVPFADGAQFCN